MELHGFNTPIYTYTFSAGVNPVGFVGKKSRMFNLKSCILFSFQMMGFMLMMMFMLMFFFCPYQFLNLLLSVEWGILTHEH